MLNLTFEITMFAFIIFTTFFVTALIFCFCNAILERLTGISLFDILQYSIDAILSGIKSFFIERK